MNPIIRMIKNALSPQGTEDVSILRLNAATCFKTEFMEKLYKELDVAIMLNQNGLDAMQPSQVLALQVLLDSGYYTRETLQKSIDRFLDFEEKQCTKASEVL